MKINVGEQTVSYNIALGTTDFFHMAYVYDGTNIYGYVNGALVGGPVAASGDGTGTYGDRFYIGAIEISPYYYASEIIDECVVWNVALSAAEVTKVYSGWKPKGGFSGGQPWIF